jgi:hypothetical protein
MNASGACSRIVEAVPRIWAMDVVDGLSMDKIGTMASTATVAGEPFAAEVTVAKDPYGRRMLLCPCGIQRRFLYIFQGKLGCQSCLRLLYWEQTAISKARWRQEVARPALRAHRRALTAASKGSRVAQSRERALERKPSRYRQQTPEHRQTE